jgi:hypothetical protein
MKNSILLPVLLVLTSVLCIAQRKPQAVCKQAVFAALRPLPELAYPCPENLSDSDEKILNLPQRTHAIESLERKLASFTDANWWNANIADLDACNVHGCAGELTKEEQEKLNDGDYWFQIFGDRQFRLVLIADRCYQTAYNGSNAFLLYRKEGKVFVSQILNGYYSRIDNSVGFDSANLNDQTLIEVSTANNMPPEFTNYYFALDPKTNRAIPKEIFKVGGRLTNEISSAVLFNENGANDAPENSVIRRNHLAPAFSAYVDDYRGKVVDNGRKLRRVIYRWNGRFYSPAK